MKSNKRNILTAELVGAAMLFSGCSSGAPKCSDSDVQKLVVDISGNIIKRDYAIFNNKPPYLNPEEFEELVSSGQKYVWSIEQLSEVIKDADAFYRGTKLVAIRLEHADDVYKVMCKGQILLTNSKTLDIKYTAQYTEDGDLFVEVFGL